MKRLLTAMLLIAGLSPLFFAHAEKADSTKPTNVEADQMQYDDVKQINTFTGNVVLTRGTILLKAHKMVVTQDPSGYQFIVMYAAPGTLASFKQKRDGGPNQWIDGQAERIEYDDKNEVMRLYSKARMRRLENTKVTDEVNGEFISYDTRAEFFTVHNTTGGDSKPGAGRIKAVIQPRATTSTKAP